MLGLLVVALADPPSFGTVLDQWSLQMSGVYAGAGVTWRRDEGRFYLMDQACSGQPMVWRLDPADPPGTIESVPWTFVDLGEPAPDIPWGIAWDSDSGCFWVSQVVDGDVYGGCYLLRHVWNGSAWVWGGTPRDSWLVGTRGNGGGLNCLCTAGMEKWHGRGCFAAERVLSTGGNPLVLPLFCPYAKSELGRVVRECVTGGSCCALVPWDSAYILTCGWEDSVCLCKYDTAGWLLQSTPLSGGPADMSVMWPWLVDPADTVCVYCINSNPGNTFQRISVGMHWSQLPSAFEQSVRPLRVLAPVGFVDSGEAIVPALVVRNDAQGTAEDVSVHFLVDDEADRVIFHDSLVVTLAPKSADTVEFAAWTATGRDSLGATAWTYWVRDRHRSDDTLSRKFLVRAQDVGITDVLSPIPDDTIDPGWVRPRCRVRNYGNVTVTFPLVFGIENWQDTMVVTSLLAGGTRVVTAADSCQLAGDTIPCTITMTCRLDADLHPENNDTAYRLCVRFPNVRIETIIAPVDTLLVNDTVRPIVRVANRGLAAAEFWLYFTVSDSVSAPVYFDSVPIDLPCSMQTTVAYSKLAIGEAGQYTASCSAYLDVRHVVLTSHEFWVIDPVGMQEQGQKPAAFGISAIRPNPFRSGTVVGFGLAEENDVEIAIFSADGRRVKGLTKGVLEAGYHRVVWDGRDDAGRNVSRGVYSLRLAAGGRVASRRIVKLE